MARKRITDLETTTNGTAVETAPAPPETTVPPTEAKKKPLVSYRCSSDRTTSLEVAVWENEVTYKDGNKGVQHSVTTRRSYCDQNGVWRDAQGLRVHDIPVLLHLIQKAYAFCLNLRTEDTSVPF